MYFEPVIEYNHVCFHVKRLGFSSKIVLAYFPDKFDISFVWFNDLLTNGLDENFYRYRLLSCGFEGLLFIIHHAFNNIINLLEYYNSNYQYISYNNIITQ